MSEDLMAKIEHADELAETIMEELAQLRKDVSFLQMLAKAQGKCDTEFVKLLKEHDDKLKELIKEGDDGK